MKTILRLLTNTLYHEQDIDKIKILLYYVNDLKSSLEHLINKFTNLIKLIKNKIFSKQDTREKYMEFSRDLYTHGIIDDKEITDIKDNYYCKNRNNVRNKDNFAIEI